LKGKKHFVIYRGVLGWGGFMFIFMTALEYHTLFGWTLAFDLHFAFSLIVNLILVLVARWGTSMGCLGLALE
jgi:hypothetical protein